MPGGLHAVLQAGGDLGGATPYLTLFSEVLGGFMLAKAALADPARAALARIYAARVLALAPGRLAAVTAGAGDLEAFDPTP